jgi:hypothetical protein
MHAAMHAENYEVVFDVISAGYTAWRAALLPAAAGLAMATLAVVVSSRTSALTKPRRAFRVICGSGAVIAFGVSAAVLYQTRREYDDLRSSLRRNLTQVVEGRVSNFVPEGPGGHPRESFSVGSARFDYSSKDITSSFQWTVHQGGPIRDGLLVRIVSVQGAIARLELSRP